MGAVAKSYLRKGVLVYEEMCKYLVIYEETVSDFGTAPFCISLYMRKILFYFLTMNLITKCKKLLPDGVCLSVCGQRLETMHDKYPSKMFLYDGTCRS